MHIVDLLSDCVQVPYSRGPADIPAFVPRFYVHVVDVIV